MNCFALEENFKSLSCSKKETGTQIIFVNGVNNTEQEAIDTASTIFDLIKNNNFKKNIDVNEKVYMDVLYNNSEKVLLDGVQTIIQKIVETGELPAPALIASFIFNAAPTCAANPVMCAAISLGFAAQFSIQEYISNFDIENMMNFSKFHLENNYKLILISHSQGNLYANYLYKEMLENGIDSSTLDKYYANFQIGSAASSTLAKNFRLFTSDKDLIINQLRDRFSTVQKANYSMQNSHPTQDYIQHGMVETYLSQFIEFNGHQQGKGSISRSARKVFLDNLEELAWTLANNDQSCCEGRDGRFYRKDYDTDPQKGFLEETVNVGEGVNLLIDEDSQICGSVSLNKSLGANSIQINKTIFDGPGHVSISGNVLITNPDQKLVSNFDTQVPIVLNNSNSSKRLVLDNVLFTGTPSISGPILMKNVELKDRPDIRGSIFSGPTSSYQSSIENATISGNSTEFTGLYFLEGRDAHNTKIEGTPIYKSNNLEWNSMFIKPSSQGLSGATLIGAGMIQGDIIGGSRIEGTKIIGFDYSKENIGGIMLGAGSSISGNVRSGIMIDNSTTFNSNFSGGYIKPDNAIAHFSSSNVQAMTVDGAPRVVNSSFNTGEIGGEPYVNNSHFNNVVGIYSNAIVINRRDGDGESENGYYYGYNYPNNSQVISGAKSYFESLAEVEEIVNETLEKNLERQAEVEAMSL